MFKLKAIRRSGGAAPEKGTDTPRSAGAQRPEDVRPQRVWSLLLPPAYFSERR
jgi:hypothetical protein